MSTRKRQNCQILIRKSFLRNRSCQTFLIITHTGETAEDFLMTGAPSHTVQCNNNYKKIVEKTVCQADVRHTTGCIPQNFISRQLYHYQLSQVKPRDLFQLRIISEIINQFQHLPRLLRRVISLSQGLRLRTTAQHRKRSRNIHVLRRIHNKNT